ncbi:hypothetical protein ABIE33_007199 [Ensifer sp. 4252]
MPFPAVFTLRSSADQFDKRGRVRRTCYIALTRSGGEAESLAIRLIALHERGMRDLIRWCNGPVATVL